MRSFTQSSSRRSRPRLLAAMLTVGVITGTGAAIPSVTSSAISKVPFTLTTSSGTVTVAPGTTSVITLSAVRARGFTAPIYLGSRSVPRGVRISTAANPLRGNTTTVKVTVDASVTPKTLSATLTGSSKGRTASRTIRIVVARSGGNALPVDPTPTTPPATLAPVTTLPAATLPPATTAAPTTLPAATTTTAPFNDYTLTAEPAALNLPAFGTATATIKIARTGTFNDILDFVVDGLPANVSYSFTPVTATSQTTTLTLSSSGAPSGLTEITVRSRARTAKIALTVGGGSALSVTPASANVAVGGTSNVALRWGRTLLTGSVVTWAATNLPSGVTATFIPNATTSVDTTVTFTAAAGSVAGLSNITVTATAGTVTDSVIVPLTVGTGTGTGTPGTGTGTVNPTAAAVNPGASTTVLFTPAGINVNQPLVLSQTGLPENVRVTAAVSGTGLNLTLATNTATVLGNYNITFTATQNGVVSSATFALAMVVVGATTSTTTPSAGQGFTYTATPVALSVARGATGSVGITPVYTGAIAPVAFTLTGAPTGTSLSFSGPNPSQGSTTLNIAVGATTPVGVYTMVLNGAITGRGSQNVTITLTVV
jgi:hypothetical protein